MYITYIEAARNLEIPRLHLAPRRVNFSNNNSYSENNDTNNNDQNNDINNTFGNNDTSSDSVNRNNPSVYK